MAFLSEDEKRALRQKQGLLYSSGQFPLVGNQHGRSRRARRPMSPVKMLVTGAIVLLLTVVGLVMLLTKSARAEPLSREGTAHATSSQVRSAALVSPQHDAERAHAEQRRAK